MSYNPLKNTGVTPFAQLSNSAGFTIGFNRYNISSVGWAVEFNEGNNGYRFRGNGYIWGHIADPGTSTQYVNSLRIGPATEPQYLWGYFYPNSQARPCADDEFLRYGNSTEMSAPYTAGTSNDHHCGAESRTNIIRMELT